MYDRAETKQTLRLVKGDRQYVFRYTPGCEDDIVDEIMRLAEDPQASLDWMDAARLSLRVTQLVAVQ